MDERADRRRLLFRDRSGDSRKLRQCVEIISDPRREAHVCMYIYVCVCMVVFAPQIRSSDGVVRNPIIVWKGIIRSRKRDLALFVVVNTEYIPATIALISRITDNFELSEQPIPDAEFARWENL